MPIESPPPCVLVTGASSGIGSAAALRFLADGWEVAVLARRQQPLQTLADRHQGRVLVLAADLTRAEPIAVAAQRLATWRPRLDVLVHCAGDFIVRPMEQTTDAEFEQLWRLMVWARFALTRELLPLLGDGIARHPRAIVHVASLAAHHDFPNETAYTSAMHAVIGLARAQDAELSPRGIRAAVVSPGTVRTPLTERGLPPEALAGALSPEAIAESIHYLTATIRAGGYIPEIFHTPQNSR